MKAVVVRVGLGAITASPSVPSPPLRPHERRTPPAAAAVGAGALLCSLDANPRLRGRRRPPPMAETHDAFSPPASEERVVVTNKHGERLVGLLHHTGSNKIVVLCHGFIATKNDSLILDLAAALTKKGISVFRFDFSGNGESEGQFEYGNYRKEADDLHSVVSYLYEKSYDITAVVGHSKGGDVVILYASVYDDVHTIVNLSGRFDLRKGIEERIGEGSINRINKEGYLDVKDKSENVNYRVTKESLTERLTTDMRAASVAISKECRFLTVHGSADKTIPVEDAYEFAKLIPNHKLHVIEGANHNYTAHRKEVADAVVDFIMANGAGEPCCQEVNANRGRGPFSYPLVYVGGTDHSSLWLAH